MPTRAKPARKPVTSEVPTTITSSMSSRFTGRVLL
jgi:hypothetical protein